MTKDNTPKPWELQPEETSRAYEAFCIYRDLGPRRSMRETAEKLGKSQGLMEGWSTKYKWGERATAWDNEQDRIARKSQLEEIKKMRKRHADIASAMLVKAARALQRIPDDEIKAGDVSRMVETASKLERLSRGDVGDVIEERNGGDAIPAVQIYVPDNGRNKREDNFEDLEV